LPLGSELNIPHTARKVTIYKDYILVEARKKEQDDQRHALSHYSTYQPEKEAQMFRNYPVTWVVDKNHTVTKLAQNESESASGKCPGKQCRGGEQVNGHSDDL